MSTDSTRKIVAGLCNKYENMQLLDNPYKTAPYALNIGIRHAKGNVIIRVDGHATIARDYLHQCVHYLSQTNAECVGGVIYSVNTTYIGRAIALAMSNSFGVGNARFRTSGKEGFVDCLAFGAYRREVFDKIGLFDEEFVRCQDDDFNYRLRQYGGKIFFTPKITAYYYPKPNLKKLWRQYFYYGYWKIRVLQKHLKRMQVRQFVPPAFVIALITTGLAGMVSNIFLVLFLITITSYVLTSFLTSIIISLKNKTRYLPILPLVFSILHFSYGLGFMVGLFRFAKYWLQENQQKGAHSLKIS